MSNVSVKQIYNLFLINFQLNITGTTSDFTKIPLLRLPTHKLSGPQFSNIMVYANTSGAFSAAFPYGASEATFGDRSYLTQSIMFSALPGYKVGLTCIIVGEPGYGWD